MRSNVGYTMVCLINGIDGTHVRRKAYLLDFLLFLIEFIQPIDGSYPQFQFILGGNESDGIVHVVMFYLFAFRIDALEVIVTSCPDKSLLVPINATDILVRSDIFVSDGLGREIIQFHVSFVDLVHARHVSTHQNNSRFHFAQGNEYIVLVLSVSLFTG